MKKKYFSFAAFILCIQYSFAQTDTLSGDAARQIISMIKLDTVKIMRDFATHACSCIDSISLINKTNKEISADVFKCIDKEVGTYQLTLQLYRSMQSGSKNNNIILNTDKESPEYQRYYFEMERWLTDSCPSIKLAAASDNKESEYSMSKDKVALGYYDKGLIAFNKDDYKTAIPWFEKAVKQDEKFAFAWDNLGVCRRNLGDLDGALEAYLKSNKLDPKGKMPLMNIPVVYEYKKDYDKALEAYENLAKVYPDDPEAYYGSGRMYEMKNDYEKALDYMCKAYNAYININSPYRSDAEKNINIYYQKLKGLGKEEVFYKILKDNHIKTN
jgi:tetratricopeptide (TPR) repeat protein